MLMRADPFRELDRLTEKFLGGATGAGWRPAVMPMDAFRSGDHFVACFDLPGVDPAAIELNVDRHVLTVKAERGPVEPGEHLEFQVSERPTGTFTRELYLGEALDAERIDATYEAGVLTLRIPVAKAAKPRRIAVTAHDSGPSRINA